MNGQNTVMMKNGYDFPFSFQNPKFIKIFEIFILYFIIMYNYK